MSLASRLAIVMVALVGITAVAIGALAYRDLQRSVVPAAVTRLSGDTVDASRNLEAFIRESQASLLGLTPGLINALALAAYDTSSRSARDCGQRLRMPSRVSKQRFRPSQSG